MSKVRCEIDLDTETGDYHLVVQNLSEPGAAVDYGRIHAILARIFNDVETQLPSSEKS